MDLIIIFAFISPLLDAHFTLERQFWPTKPCCPGNVGGYSIYPRFFIEMNVLLFNPYDIFKKVVKSLFFFLKFLPVCGKTIIETELCLVY